MSKVFTDDCLSGKTFFVSGASSGIGRMVALSIAFCGGRVLLTGRNSPRLYDTLAALKGDGHCAIEAQLNNADQAYEVTQDLVNKHGPLSGLFHSAGIELVRPIKLIKQAQLDDVFGSSLLAGFGIARALSKKNALLDGSSLVFMSSVAGLTGQLGLSAYGASRAGINGFVKSLACEFSARSIRVNSIAAGAVETEMHHRITQAGGSEAEESYRDAHLLGFGSPQDIADAAIFLLSDASRWITGTTLVVDGGYVTR